jgi:hypothetical protein
MSLVSELSTSDVRNYEAWDVGLHETSEGLFSVLNFLTFWDVINIISH